MGCCLHREGRSLTSVCRSPEWARWASPGRCWSEPSCPSRPGGIAQSSQCDPSRSRTGTCRRGGVAGETAPWQTTCNHVTLVFSAALNPPSHPLLGKTAMALGSSRLLLTRTLRLIPSRRATSMVLRPVSVQYMFLATQSTASPSVVFRPWLITVSIPLPSRFERLENKVQMVHYRHVQARCNECNKHSKK